jgi:hypothetical protein
MAVTGIDQRSEAKMLEAESSIRELLKLFGLYHEQAEQVPPMCGQGR